MPVTNQRPIISKRNTVAAAVVICAGMLAPLSI